MIINLTVQVTAKIHFTDVPLLTTKNLDSYVNMFCFYLAEYFL